MTNKPPHTWEQLYAHFRTAEAQQQELEQMREQEVEALREFEAWAQQASERMMQDLKLRAEQRSRDFYASTGGMLRVEYPSGPPILQPNGGPEIRFLRLSLGAAQVHVYSSHARGGLTHVHLLPSRTSSLAENSRLISEPGAFLVRQSNDGYELRYLRDDPEGAAGTPMTLDTLMFRAFRLLVSWTEVAQTRCSMPEIP